MNHAEILTLATDLARAGKVTAQNTKGKIQKVTSIHGSRLDYPRATLEYGGSVEISWALAERIATGKSKRILL